MKCIICGKLILNKKKVCVSCQSFLDSLPPKIPIQLLEPRLPPQIYSSEDSQRQDSNNDGEDKYFPYPYIFKPPEPPVDIIGATQLQVYRVRKREKRREGLYCKHCGAELPKGQAICHACGKKVR